GRVASLRRVPGQRRKTFFARGFGRFDNEAVLRAVCAFKHELRPFGGLGDVSADVCALTVDRGGHLGERCTARDIDRQRLFTFGFGEAAATGRAEARSEERRVGKEWS